MITAQAILSRYSEVETLIPFILGRVRETLVTFAEPRGFAVLVRAKTVESLAEKIETGRFSCWSQIDDLVAGTVVVPGLTDEVGVLTFLRSAFREVRTIARGSSKKAPDVFRFDSTRFIGKLALPDGIPQTEPTYEVLFEIQIRTAFEHAWSVTTHGLTYKNAEVDWKRLRLAAQLKAAVEQLDMLVAGFSQNADLIGRSSWPDTEAKEGLVTNFRVFFAEGTLPPELTPKDWTRFADNIYALLCATESLRRDAPNEKVGKACASVSAYLRNPTNPIPTSLSLAQLVLVILLASAVIAPPFRKFTPVITPEMEILFPVLSGITERFDFELTEPVGAPDMVEGP